MFCQEWKFERPRGKSDPCAACSARPSQRSGKRAIGCREMGNRRRLRLLRDHVCAAAGESEAEVQAAYARAEVFTNVAALNQHLNAGEATPHFSADGHVWWLRRWTTPEGDEPAKQFMRIAYADVDPQPVPAFDHQRLAAGLVAAGLTAEPALAWALPFSSLSSARLAGSAPQVTFILGDQHCRCDLLSYVCDVVPPEPQPPIDAGILSPDGTHVAFVRQHNVWVRSVATGEETALTHDGREGYIYAAPLPDPVQMVSELSDKPMHSPRLQWSPDSTKIATFALSIPPETQLLGMAQNAPADRYRPRHYIYPYPLPVDQQLPSSTPKMLDLTTASEVPVAATDSNTESQWLPGGYGGAGYGGIYFQWSRDSASVRYTETERGYTAYRLREIDAATGSARTVVEERDEFTVGPCSNHGSYSETVRVGKTAFF